MNDCDKYSGMISAYIDGELEEENQQLLLAHTSQCPRCAAELKCMLEIQKSIQEAPLVPLPEGFHESLHEKLVESMKPEKRVPFYRNLKVYSSLAAVLIFAFVIKAGFFQNDITAPSVVPQATAPVQTQLQSGDVQKVQPEPSHHDGAQRYELPPSSDANVAASKPGEDTPQKFRNTVEYNVAPQQKEKDAGQQEAGYTDAQPSQTPENDKLPVTDVPPVNTMDMGIPQATPVPDPKSTLLGQPEPEASQMEKSASDSNTIHSGSASPGGGGGSSSAETAGSNGANTMDVKAQLVVMVQSADLEKAKALFPEESYTKKQVAEVLEKNAISYEFEQKYEDQQQGMVVIKLNEK